MVPGSTLMYGSSFCMETLSPRRSRIMPMAADVRPLPRLETTPPVMKMCFGINDSPRCSVRKQGCSNWTLPSTLL